MSFDHLDDPQGAAPSPDLRGTVLAAGRRRLRRRRVLTGAISSCVILIAGIGLAGAWTEQRLDDIERVDVTAGVLDEPIDGEPVNVLLVGTDRDPHRAMRSAAGVDGPAAADAVLLLRLDPSAGTLRGISLPRDLWIGEKKLAYLLAEGGPDALIAGVEATVDLPVHHYVQLEVGGIAALVDRIGGIDVQLPASLFDPLVRITLGGPGCRTLDGAAAAALLRSRHLQIVGPDAIDSYPPSVGDLDRIARQQVLAAVMIGTVDSLGMSPTDALALLDIAVEHGAIDPTLDDATMLRWARWGLSLDPGDIDLRTLATTMLQNDDGSIGLDASDDARAEARGFLIAAAPPEVIDLEGVPRSTQPPGLEIRPCDATIPVDATAGDTAS